MFINIMQYPAVKAGRDADFREWFRWSNAEYATYEGFVSRRLLRPRKGGDYVVVIEHRTFETFMAMHKSPAQAEAHARLEPLLDGSPKAQFYDVVET